MSRDGKLDMLAAALGGLSACAVLAFLYIPGVLLTFIGVMGIAGMIVLVRE